MKTKLIQLVFRILRYTAILGWIVVTILNLIDGKYFIAIGCFCFGLVFFFPQLFKKNQP
tara:strand:+ start:345 stop:521 length:177 start_codon:yes stop_codon:yes gene_type:complete